MKQITISIVEDNRGTRENLVALFDGEPELHCLRAYATGEEAVRGIPEENPDVVVVDIKLPRMNGISCVTKLKILLPKLCVLMLTTYEETDLIFNSLRAGASGYLLKEMPHADLVQAIKDVHAGGAPMSMQIARKVVDHFHRIKQPASEMEALTVREHEILALLSKGRLYKEIAEQLGISPGTVRTHLEHVYQKLHVQTRTEAVLKFLGEN
jgi:DNA-binding NarL/FixJ family response regulator